ncbi:hypothetical protein DOY81_009315 [Sarcophaga bullata]|nr:hypothetical protein DOY81_009315 [Sarcophaga bullata]
MFTLLPLTSWPGPKAPLTTTIRGTQGLSGGGRCESSIGGSEYSFPPSYRSRQTLPPVPLAVSVALKLNPQDVY